MTPAARLEATPAGLVPVTDGWFVVNAREARWRRREGFGATCPFEGEGEAEFAQLGFALKVLEPGEPNGFYHAERGQEDFLVVSGECVLLVEGTERRLRAWDFVHCPPETAHVFVGAGEGPCVLVMVGSRLAEGIRYEPSELAARYGASVERETDTPAEAYAGLPSESCPAPEGALPDGSRA